MKIKYELVVLQGTIRYKPNIWPKTQRDLKLETSDGKYHDLVDNPLLMQFINIAVQIEGERQRYFKDRQLFDEISVKKISAVNNTPKSTTFQSFTPRFTQQQKQPTKYAQFNYYSTNVQPSTQQSVVYGCSKVPAEPEKKIVGTLDNDKEFCVSSKTMDTSCAREFRWEDGK